MVGLNLIDYLEKIKQTDNRAQLIAEYGVYDNFSIAFYGRNTEQIIDTLREGVRESTFPDYLIGQWREIAHYKKGEATGYVGGQPCDTWIFEGISAKVIADLNRFPDSDGKNRLHGLPLAEVSLTLHPQAEKGIEDYLNHQERLKTAILDWGYFIVKKHLAAGFTKKRANAYHIP